MQVWDAPRGNGPYGIAAHPQGSVWYVSLAGNYLAEIDRATGTPRIVEPPTPQQGAAVCGPTAKAPVGQRMEQRQLSMHDRKDGSWKKWKLPGERPRAYSVYVDDRDAVWLTDFAANAIVRFDPKTETFLAFRRTSRAPMCARWPAAGRGLGRRVSGTNRLVVIDKPQA